MLEKTTRMNVFLDRYGVLLSEKQLKYMQLYYRDDLSLGEIAEEENVSRQAVYDQIRRAEEQLELFEEKMHLLELSQRREVLFDQLHQVLSACSHRCTEELEKGLQILKQLRELE